MDTTKQTRSKGRKRTAPRQEASASAHDRKRTARRRKASASDAPDIRTWAEQVELLPPEAPEPKTVLQSKVDTLIGLLGETQPAASTALPSHAAPALSPQSASPATHALHKEMLWCISSLEVAMAALPSRRQGADEDSPLEPIRFGPFSESDRQAVANSIALLKNSAAGTDRAARRSLGGRAVAQGGRDTQMERRVLRASRHVPPGGQVGPFATMVGQAHRRNGRRCDPLDQFPHAAVLNSAGSAASSFHAPRSQPFPLYWIGDPKSRDRLLDRARDLVVAGFDAAEDGGRCAFDPGYLPDVRAGRLLRHAPDYAGTRCEIDSVRVAARRTKAAKFREPVHRHPPNVSMALTEPAEATMLRRTALFAAIAAIGLSAVCTLTLAPSTPANARATASVKFKEASNLRMGTQHQKAGT